MKQSSDRVACFDLSALQILLVLYTKKIFSTVGFRVATHRGVFSQLAKRREGLSVSPADLLHNHAKLLCQFISLHDGHPHFFLLPLPPVSVVSHCCRTTMTQLIGCLVNNKNVFQMV